jgi:hypothetical protein
LASKILETEMKILLPVLTLFLLAPLACSDDAKDEKPIIIQTDLDFGQVDADRDMSTVETNKPDVSVQPDMTSEDATPDLPVVEVGTICQNAEAPIQLAKTCQFEWSSCEDGVDYSFRCDIKNLAGNIFSLCNCYENGVKDPADKIVDVCSAQDWASIEAIVNEECGWDLR